MNTTIRDRTELLLAKLAGQDVKLDDMTPGSASNLKEKLILDIAMRLDNMAQTITDMELFTINYQLVDYFEEQDIYSCICDKTYAEIVEAYNSDKLIVANVALEGLGSVRCVNCAMDTFGTIQFTAVEMLDNGMFFQAIIHRTDDTIIAINTPLSRPGASEMPRASYVSDAIGEYPTASEFNELLNALRSAGFIET